MIISATILVTCLALIVDFLLSLVENGLYLKVLKYLDSLKGRNEQL